MKWVYAELPQVKSRVTRRWAQKCPGKERQTRGNAISRRGVLFKCLLALIQLCRAGVALVCVCAGVTAAPGRRAIFLACCKERSFCLDDRYSCLIAASPTRRVGNAMPSANAPGSARRTLNTRKYAISIGRLYRWVLDKGPPLKWLSARNCSGRGFLGWRFGVIYSHPLFGPSVFERDNSGEPGKVKE